MVALCISVYEINFHSLQKNMMPMLIQTGRSLLKPKIWRIVGFASAVVGLLCYALSSSFNHLFGQWNSLKLFLYTVFSFIISLMILFPNIWQHSRSVQVKAHSAFLVLTITAVYSFFFDKVVTGKPDAYSLISCAAFAIMSLSLSRQTQCGFEIDLLYFFLGCLIVQLMKIKSQLVVVGAGFSYSLIILSSSYSSTENEYPALEDEHSVVIEVDSPQPASSDIAGIDSSELGSTDIASMMEQLRTYVKALQHLEHPENEMVVTNPALPSSGTINGIQETAKRMVDCGFEKVCSHVYSSCRREVLEESLSRLGLQKLYIENVHKMPWLDLEAEIKRWIKASDVALKILFPTERKLCDRVFFRFSSTADFSFNEVCRGSIIQLLNFANAVAIGSGSPQRLFRIIDVFETMRDLIPEFESLFRDKYSAWVRNEAIIVWNRLGEAIRGIFMELEYMIRLDLEKVAFPDGMVHPNTRYVLNYLRAACWSQRTLEQVFEDYGRLFKKYPVPYSSSLSRKMHFIMELLESNLEAKSKIYEDPALCYGFLMSNGRYIVKMTKDSELGALLGDDWIREQTAKVRHYHVEYQRNSWDKLLGFLNLESIGSVPPGEVAKSMKEKLKSFNVLFEDICRVQLSWFDIIDGQLREEISTSVLNILMPAYRNFIGRFQGVPELGKHADVKYGTWDLKIRLVKLFQGETEVKSANLPFLQRETTPLSRGAYGIGIGTG